MALDRRSASFLGSRRLVACLLASIAPIAGAQEETQQSIKIGEADLYPSIRVDYITNDNIGLSARDEIDGDAVLVGPQFEFVANKRTLEFQAGYTGLYSAGSEDQLDWDDHTVSASLSADFDKRRRGSALLQFVRGHQEIGTLLTRGIGNDVVEPIVYNQFRLNSAFGYGAKAARGNVSAGLRLDSRTYTNQEELTDGRDFVVVEPFVRFGYRVTGDTRTVFELRYRNAAFDDEAASYNEIGTLIGLTFSATGSLTGEAFIGVGQVDYDQIERQDEAIALVNIGLVYAPVSFSEFTLNVVREINNSGFALTTGDSGSIETNGRLGWEHEWSSRVSSDAFAFATLNEDGCPEADTTTVGAGFELNVLVRRWFEVGAGVQTTSRTADACEDDDDPDRLEYDRVITGGHVRFTL